MPKTEASIAERRLKSKERMRLSRERRKAEKTKNVESISPIGSYKCSQTFGKAINRLKKSLPQSPQKKVAVVKKLVADILGPDARLLEPLPKKQGASSLITNETKKVVEDFFKQDSISYQTPGIKDCITVKRLGKRKRTEEIH